MSAATVAESATGAPTSEPSNPASTHEPVIHVRGLCRTFGTLEAVKGLDLDIHRGEVFGLLGPNGAGKSTTFRMLLGLLAPTSGVARVLDLEMPRQSEALRPLVGYMPQHFSLYGDLSVEENLDFVAEVFGLGDGRRERVEAVMSEYELLERCQQRAATLSGGWKQRLALAAATIHRPELLFLDEPTAGVDPERRRIFWQKLFELAAGGMTIIVSTHYMDEATRCHRLAMVRDGQLAALGTPVDLVEALRHRSLEVSGEDPATLLPWLQAQTQVASVAQLGTRVHVLLTPDAPPAATLGPELERWLRSQGYPAATVRVAEPNLEDVFVALTQGENFG